jgi:predicted DNA-binding transcriptional regulator AlpA
MIAGAALPIVPRILRRELAALYVGLAVSTWDVEVAAGRAPQPVQVTNGVKGWDRHDLDAWIEDRKASQSARPNSWDDV